MDGGAFSDDGKVQEYEEALHQGDSRRLRSAYQIRKGDKVEQVFAKLPREARYRTGPWTQRKGPVVPGIVERNPTKNLYAHVVNYRTYRIRFMQRVAVVPSGIMKRNVII